jgi:hypothetical protein
VLDALSDLAERVAVLYAAAGEGDPDEPLRYCDDVVLYSGYGT